ncbi:hypothetical protein DPEC_G00056240 [Dallia pectoralis]|uniref:Uncharacterized protein n=1 Tax=Dallia pectoralis TaxID=75939 RepID=A0ACC2H5P6_DALPE|nr:hypothetical protein DPEC_G00056240 [Dallia pectoralis]
MTVVNQIKAWTGTTTCKRGEENCMYELISVTPFLIKASKTSPSTKSVSDLTFTLAPTMELSRCLVTGDAISESSMSWSENGIPYCSLEDLIIGSGLGKTPGFKEFTSDWICLGFSLGNCTTTTSLKRTIGE